MNTALTVPLRLASTRLPQKLLARVGSRSLAERALKDARDAARKVGGTAQAALCPLDEPLLEIARRMEVEIFERDRRSRDGETAEDIYHDWSARLRDRFDWVVVMNPCMPFLTVETLVRAVEHCRQATRVFTSVFAHRGPLWDAAGRRIVGAGTTPNTKTNPLVYQPAHAFYGYPVERLGQSDAYDDVELVQVQPGPEFLDIDTPEDLEFARTYAAGLAVAGEVEWDSRSALTRPVFRCNPRSDGDKAPQPIAIRSAIE